MSGEDAGRFRDQESRASRESREGHDSCDSCEGHVRRLIVVRGAVQGVGFRPHVYRHATALGLVGWVGNTPEGLRIEAEGSPAAVAAFLQATRDSAPTHARIADLSIVEAPPRGEQRFVIRESLLSGSRRSQMLPDLATCDACLAELYDPSDRRFRYPFVSCTECGPRYTIIEELPYDRARTSMRAFAMCGACQAEYRDPAERRFHAEANACPDCGPQLALWDASGAVLARGDAALVAAGAALREGGIVAAKGVGGFHLLADAGDEAVVRRLRARKRRPEKPFAVMFPDLEALRGSCHVEAATESLLTGPARPIVLLPRRAGPIAEAVAPGSPRLGAFLPYAPMHHLLLGELGAPMVATSANPSDEPIVFDEAEATRRLAGIADLFLVHDRPILRPVDDSVAQLACGRPQLLRSARGHAPMTIAVEAMTEGILAYGGHMKATIASSVGHGISLTQHLGDLGSQASRDAYRAALEDVVRLQEKPPRVAVRDLHPDYVSSREAETSGLAVCSVPHHLAHVSACLAEHGQEPPVLGVAWDGTGYGPDGTIWGGEFLQLSERSWRRVAHLRPFRLPGGDAAAREPRRAALGLLYAAFGDDAFSMADLPAVASWTPAERGTLRTMLERGVHSPFTSSVGRLFDAFAALAGLRLRSSYEGQAAAELEAAAGDQQTGPCYAFPVSTDREGVAIIDWQPALLALLADLRATAKIASISFAFHEGLAAAIVEVARCVGERRVVLSGGCFQNVRLTEAAVRALRAAGFEPFWHQRIPPNDGGLSLGQAAWAARVMQDMGGTPDTGEKTCA